MVLNETELPVSLDNAPLQSYLSHQAQAPTIATLRFSLLARSALRDTFKP